MNLDEKGIYFNIGFRAATSERTLIELKEGKYNLPLLQDAYKIVDHCDKSLGGQWPLESFSNLQESWVYNRFFFGENKEFNDLAIRYLKREEVLEKIENVRETKESLERIIKKEEVSEEDLDQGIRLFDDLQKFCLNHNIKPKYGCYD